MNTLLWVQTLLALGADAGNRNEPKQGHTHIINHVLHLGVVVRWPARRRNAEHHHTGLLHHGDHHIQQEGGRDVGRLVQYNDIAVSTAGALGVWCTHRGCVSVPHPMHRITKHRFTIGVAQQCCTAALA